MKLRTADFVRSGSSPGLSEMRCASPYTRAPHCIPTYCVAAPYYYMMAAIRHFCKPTCNPCDNCDSHQFLNPCTGGPPGHWRQRGPSRTPASPGIPRRRASAPLGAAAWRSRPPWRRRRSRSGAPAWSGLRGRSPTAPRATPAAPAPRRRRPLSCESLALYSHGVRGQERVIMTRMACKRP